MSILPITDTSSPLSANDKINEIVDKINEMASSVKSTYSSTGTDPINGTGVKAALDTLNIPTTSNTYVSTSTNAMTGRAVAQALATLNIPTTSNTYSATSTSAMTGRAVAQALATISDNTAMEIANVTQGSYSDAWNMSLNKLNLATLSASSAVYILPEPDDLTKACKTYLLVSVNQIPSECLIFPKGANDSTKASEIYSLDSTVTKFSATGVYLLEFMHLGNYKWALRNTKLKTSIMSSDTSVGTALVINS